MSPFDDAPKPNYDHIEKMSATELARCSKRLPENYRKVRDMYPGAILFWREKDGVFVYLDSLEKCLEPLSLMSIYPPSTFCQHFDEMDFRWAVDYICEYFAEQGVSVMVVDPIRTW